MSNIYENIPIDNKKAIDRHRGVASNYPGRGALDNSWGGQEILGRDQGRPGGGTFLGKALVKIKNQTDRQKEKQTDRKRETDRQKERDRQTEREGQTDRKRETDRQRERQRDI